MSSHGLGLHQAIELARALGQLPGRCVVYAIEGASFEAGAPLSPAVAAGAVEATERVRAEIAAATDSITPAPGGSLRSGARRADNAEMIELARELGFLSAPG